MRCSDESRKPADLVTSSEAGPAPESVTEAPVPSPPLVTQPSEKQLKPDQVRVLSLEFANHHYDLIPDCIVGLATSFSVECPPAREL